MKTNLDRLDKSFDPGIRSKSERSLLTSCMTKRSQVVLTMSGHLRPDLHP